MIAWKWLASSITNFWCRGWIFDLSYCSFRVFTCFLSVTISGAVTANCMTFGYQGWLWQLGTMIIYLPDLSLSSEPPCLTNWKVKMHRIFQYSSLRWMHPPHGPKGQVSRHETYLSSWLFIWDAKRSSFGLNSFLVILSNISLSSIHLVLSLKIREALSAATFVTPGTWAALNQTSLWIHQSQVSSERLLHSNGFGDSHIVDICHCCGVINHDMDMPVVRLITKGFDSKKILLVIPGNECGTVSPDGSTNPQLIPHYIQLPIQGGKQLIK